MKTHVRQENKRLSNNWRRFQHRGSCCLIFRCRYSRLLLQSSRTGKFRPREVNGILPRSSKATDSKFWPHFMWHYPSFIILMIHNRHVGKYLIDNSV
ncbi:hypothetical protein NPIL_408701 [Nephila pilipes]|uniref:Uncharacterized protein n=1 Tax=Nephila pilipes TaxID=299642 RepID=A0A8X6N031_NEPPI|nr:hypothetical protein NPIL_408701 [Nephila pilipes]